MKVLILGGTGAMGVPLSRLLLIMGMKYMSLQERIVLIQPG